MTDAGKLGSNVSIALLHYPVYDKNRQVVATAVTNLDLHDIARAARTYGLYRYFVVTPVEEQRVLAERIACHWREGFGASYNPKRKAALDLVRVTASLDEALDALEEEFGRPAQIVATGAAERPGSISSSELAELVGDTGQPWLLLLGTGWGLADELFDLADYVLAPIRGADDYNHLPVRSAAAIILDRLFGNRKMA